MESAQARRGDPGRQPSFGAEALALLGREPADAREAALRALLGRMTDALAAGEPVADADLEELNGWLARAPVVARVLRDGRRYVVAMTPVRPDPLREAAGSFASLLRFAPGRLKRCPACDRAFVDESRNRSRRWCDGRGCGNRARVAAFRARGRR